MSRSRELHACKTNTFVVSTTNSIWQSSCYHRRLINVNENVKCTVVQALRLCTGRTAYRGIRGIGKGKVHRCTGTEALYRPYDPKGSRYIALLFLDHGTRRGWVVSVTPWPLFTSGIGSVPIVQEAGWAPRPVWTCVENLAPTSIRSPNRPARSQSLYLLRCPAH